MDDVDLAADPWVRISWSDDGVTVLCERPECMTPDAAGRLFWWEEEVVGYHLRPEEVLAAANAHRRTHPPEVTP